MDELTDFFEENDMSAFADEMPEVEFEVDLRRRAYYVEVDSDVAEQIYEISKREHLPSDAIVNSWLREKLSNHPK